MGASVGRAERSFLWQGGRKESLGVTCGRAAREGEAG